MSEPIAGGCVTIRPAPLTVSAGDEIGITLLSDLHVGAANVDYRQILAELESARVRNDRILINGDVIDAILPSDKRRYSVTAIHPRLRDRPDLLDAEIEWAVSLLAPYADRIDMIGSGNHETAVEHHHASDPIRRIVDTLHSVDGCRVRAGGVTGFVRYRFRGSKRRSYRPLTIFYHHGSGRGSTLGTTLRALVGKSWVDADVIWEGHRHTQLSAARHVVRCAADGEEPVVHNQRLVATGSYLWAYSGQSADDFWRRGRQSNYAADNGLPPHSLGGARLTLEFGESDYVLRVTQ